MSATIQLVIVDDEPRVTQSLEREIRLEFGTTIFETVCFNDPEESLGYIREHRNTIFLVISDLRMPQMNGSELLQEIRKESPDIQTVLLTAYTDIENIQQAISASIQSLLFKPWTREAIIAEIEKARNIWKLRQEKKLLEKHMDDMLRTTGEFQAKLFAQSIPETTKIHFDVAFQPYDLYHCGGDFYDIQAVGKDRYTVILGDVTGHGPKSAMIAGMLKTAMESVIQNDPALKSAPDALLEKLNDQFCKMLSSAPDTLIALSVLYIDIPGRILSIATAGLPPIIHVRNGSPELLLTPNHLLGAFPDTPFYKTERVMYPGDNIIMITDGLLESVPDFFSISQEKLSVLFTNRTDFSARVISEDLRKCFPGGKFTDDATVVSLKIQSEEEQ